MARGKIFEISQLNGKSLKVRAFAKTGRRLLLQTIVDSAVPNTQNFEEAQYYNLREAAKLKQGTEQ